jgi:hypothetical protein
MTCANLLSLWPATAVSERAVIMSRYQCGPALFEFACFKSDNRRQRSAALG